MATKQEPIRRNDVIRCDKCGEDYSVTYKRCPFCDERPPRTRKVNGGTSGSGRRVAGGGGPAQKKQNVNPLQVAGIVGSLVLIIAALYIVFSVISPLLGIGKDDDPGSQSSTSTPSVSHSTPAPSVSQPSVSSPSTSAPEVVEPVVTHVNSLKLSKSDFTLSRNETWQIKATVEEYKVSIVEIKSAIGKLNNDSDSDLQFFCGVLVRSNSDALPQSICDTLDGLFERSGMKKQSSSRIASELLTNKAISFKHTDFSSDDYYLLWVYSPSLTQKLSELELPTIPEGWLPTGESKSVG